LSNLKIYFNIIYQELGYGMEVTGTPEWVKLARAAARNVVNRLKPTSPVRSPASYPEPPTTQSGLRGLDQTQSPEAVEGKGLIINRYL
jgi:hypothetical protein